MAREIDMQLMRYINLFSRVAKVSTTRCFVYNNNIIFAVPKSKVSIAIGKGAMNVKKLRGILRKNIKIIEMPVKDDVGGIGKFVKDVVDPIEFNGVEVKNNLVTINAGRQSKAALIGRGRIREKELEDVLRDYFGVTRLRIS